MGLACQYDELKSLFSYAENLPQAPNSPLKLSQLLEAPDAAPQMVEELVLSDPALTAGILKTASSAAFGRMRPVNTVREAIMVLGFRALRSIAIALWTNALVAQARKSPHLEPDRFAQSGVAVGTLASLLYRESEINNPEWTKEEIFAAGILNGTPTGLLAILSPTTFEAIFLDAQRNRTSIQQAFADRYDESLQALGAQAAQVMGLPEIFVHSIAGWQVLPADSPLVPVFQCVDAAQRVVEARGESIVPWKTENVWPAELQIAFPYDDAQWAAKVHEARSSSGGLLAAVA